MATVFAALIILVCLLLILIVLVQNPKGGGLSSSFGGSGTQVFGGVKKTTDFLDKGTWALAIILVVLVLSANVSLTPGSSPQAPESRIMDNQPPQSTPGQQPMNLPGKGQGQSPQGQGQGQPQQGQGQTQQGQAQKEDLGMPESVDEEE